MKEVVKALRPFAAVHTVHNPVTQHAEKFKIIDKNNGEHLSPYYKYETDAWVEAYNNLQRGGIRV